MRLLKAWLVFAAVALLLFAGIYYAAEAIEQPFYAVPLLYAAIFIACCAAAFYLGSSGQGILLLQTPLLLCFMLMPMLLLFFAAVGGSFWRGTVLIFMLAVTIAAFGTAYIGRILYLRKRTKYKE